MFKMLRWSRIFMVGALLAAGSTAQAQEENEPMLTLDEEYARLAEAVPGFGGLYLDEEGTVHVYLQDLSRAREVQDLGEQVEVHQGEYDFRDLLSWKGEARELLAQPGTVFLDIAEQRNRLLVGVEREALGAFTAELPELLRSTRVPLEAVLVEAAEPIVTQELLTDWFAPVPGGTQIQNDSGGICTLGFNATRLGVRGFITNSHCTNQRGGVEGTLFYRKAIGPFNLIGTEIVDPLYLPGGGCPSGKICRDSDAAFVDYTSDSMSAGGQIANPLVCGIGYVPGTLQVNPNEPRLSVTGGLLFGSPASGSLVTRVGRTSGCVHGTQQNTCIDVNVSKPLPNLPGWSVSTIYTMLCQNRVWAIGQPGDSGSPVFLADDGEATVVGIHWGGSGSFSVYSPWTSIHSELGAPLLDLE